MSPVSTLARTQSSLRSIKKDPPGVFCYAFVRALGLGHESLSILHHFVRKILSTPDPASALIPAPQARLRLSSPSALYKKIQKIPVGVLFVA